MVNNNTTGKCEDWEETAAGSSNASLADMEMVIRVAFSKDYESDQCFHCESSEVLRKISAIYPEAMVELTIQESSYEKMLANRVALGEKCETIDTYINKKEYTKIEDYVEDDWICATVKTPAGIKQLQGFFIDKKRNKTSLKEFEIDVLDVLDSCSSIEIIDSINDNYSCAMALCTPEE